MSAFRIHAGRQRRFPTCGPRCNIIGYPFILYLRRLQFFHHNNEGQPASLNPEDAPTKEDEIFVANLLRSSSRGWGERVRLPSQTMLRIFFFWREGRLGRYFIYNHMVTFPVLHIHGRHFQPFILQPNFDYRWALGNPVILRVWTEIRGKNPRTKISGFLEMTDISGNNLTSSQVGIFLRSVLSNYVGTLFSELSPRSPGEVAHVFKF